jgi:hypothetical protein
MLTPDLRDGHCKSSGSSAASGSRSVLSATDVDLDTVLTAGDVDDTVGGLA